MSFLNIDLFAWITILVLAVLMPLDSRREMKNLRAAVARGDEGVRLGIYNRTITMEWALAAVGLTVWFALGRSSATIWLERSAEGLQWLAIGISAVLIIFFGWQARRAADDEKAVADTRNSSGKFKDFLPHSDADLRRFYWLSLAAGVCEEILYRGLLMGALEMTLGLWPAVILSSVVFGISHSYQGPIGMVRTGSVGLVLALVVVFTGSLWMAMIAHFVLDFAQGKMLQNAMNLPAEAV